MPEDRSVLSRPSPPPQQVLRYGPDSDHIAEVRFTDPAQPHRPLLVLVHGGFWRPEYDRTHAGPMSHALAAAGWTVATIEYRRCPGAPDATVDDIQRAIEQLPQLVPHHDGRLILIGHSAGGHLVLWAASRGHPTVHAVLALAPAADLRMGHARRLGDGAVQAFLGCEPQLRPDLDPAVITPARVHTVLLHGEADDIVPLALAEAYHAHNPEARLIRLPEVGHFAVIDPLSSAWPQVLEALDSLI